MPGGRDDATEPVLDLHGLTVAEARQRVAAFLVAHQARGTVSVRIVTGRGTGALRSAVADLLRAHPAVASTQTPLQGNAAVLVVLRAPARNPGQRGLRAR